MTRIAELDDAAVDQVLHGSTPVGCEDLAPVAELVAAVRQTGTAGAPVMGRALRAQIKERPYVPPRHVGAPRRRYQLAVAAAALLFVGVAAGQNALPAAAQRFVASAGDLVGLDVPRPDDEAPSAPGEDPTPIDATDSTGSTDPSEGTGPGGSTRGADDQEGTQGGPSAPNGPPEQTPGGATPADPGAPGDGDPATPAEPATPTTEPPPHSNSGGNPPEPGDRGPRDLSVSQGEAKAEAPSDG